MNKKWIYKAVSLMLVFCMFIGVLPSPVVATTSTEIDVTASLEEAKTYIDALTINNSSNDPATVVKNFKTHFTWDNEKREDSKGYLYDWSYYNGVVFEGIEYVYEVTNEEVYKNYVLNYMASLINSDGTWSTCSNDTSKQCAGYNATHGADCYKTASLLLDAYEMSGDSRYLTMAETLYKDLDTAASTYSLSNAGNNYRHTWASDPTPDLWLDGLYMILPFRAEYAKHINDTEELDLIVDRMQWVSDNMYNSSNGLFYHAADSASSNSGTYWLRSIGWYAAAIVDIMDSMEGENLEAMKKQLVKLVDGMKACQNTENGMWLNNLAASQSSSNPYETSGTALTCYAVMKAVNNGWLDASYADMALLAFNGICNEKLEGTTLTDICFKGAPGSSNSTFYDNEGKGVGPFIMFYAEVLKYTNTNNPEEDTETTESTVLTDSDTNVSVSSIGITGLTVETVDSTTIKDQVADIFTEDFVAYDINVENFTTGSTATVTVPIPTGYDADKFAVYHLPTDGSEPEKMVGKKVDNETYEFTTTHFSVYVGGVLKDDVTIIDTEAVIGTGNLEGSYTYTLDTDGLDYGVDNKYLIVAYNSGYALTANGSNTGVTPVTITNNTITTTTNANDWYFIQDSSITEDNTYNTIITQNGTTWLYHTNSSMYVGNGNDAHRGFWNLESRSGGYYRFRDLDWSQWRLYYNNGKFTVRNDPNNSTYVRLFRQTSATPGTGVTFKVSPKTSTILAGSENNLTYEVVLADGTVVDSADITWSTDDASIATVSDGVVTGVSDGTTTITATLTAVNGRELSTAITLDISVEVVTKQISSWTLTGNNPRSTPLNTEPNFDNVKLNVVYTDGSTGEITVDSGLVITDYDITKSGSYYALVSYGDKVYGTIRVDVLGDPYDGLTETTVYPEYPEQGAVSLDKKATADPEEFARTGVTHVELQVAGISTQKAVDVVLVVDVSNSMAWSLENSGNSSDADRVPSEGQQSKMEITMESCKEFVQILMEDNKDGTTNDNSVTFVTFGGFDKEHTASNYTDTYFDSTNTWLTGSKDETEINALLDSVSIVRDTSTSSGYMLSIDGTSKQNFGNTVYDYAFAETLNAIEAMQGDNYDTEKRETYVVFMTDGAPSNYNGGYYKGGRNENYKVDSNSVFDNKGSEDKDTWYSYICSAENTYARKVYDKVNGNFSTVGFDLAHGGFSSMQWTETELTTFLEKIVRNSDGEGLNEVVSASNKETLVNFYKDAAEAIKAAGSQGRVTDVVDSDFTLQTAMTVGPKNEATGEVTTLNTAPIITVTKYDLYTAKDTDDLAKIGTRKVDADGNYIKEVLETVTFSYDGTEAYSDRVSNGTQNIMTIGSDGTVTINAQTFTYTKEKDENGKEVETFDWFIETISEKEVVLEFDAYLRGALEGEAPEGTYYTNEYATLEYIDVNGNYVNRYFPVPVVNWGGATTTIRYYLVNEKGEPVNSVGQVIPFAARVYVGDPVTLPLNLNDDMTINSDPINASAHVPEGYYLYDNQAHYAVHTVSSTEGVFDGGVEISEPSTDAYKTTVVDGVSITQTGAQTTFCIDHEPDYWTYSTVIFGLRWDLTTETIDPLENDQIVIDYGKAIQVNVLANDEDEITQICNDKSTNYITSVVGFVKYNENTRLNEIKVSAGEPTFNADFGTFTIANNGNVQYQPTKMISDVEKVFCVVKFVNSSNLEDYFYMYEQLDVIPATNIYYETNFANVFELITTGTDWTQNTDPNETTAADNLQDDGTIGVNQTYGYDSSYIDDPMLSNGSSYFVNGQGIKSTTAKFSFTGTGFDLISRTGENQGAIRVDIYTDEARTTRYKSVTVLNKSESKLELYQIPVVSVNDLPYDTYYVTIGVNAAFSDETYPQLNRGGEFYFDAIRIYDPAKGNEEAEAAYVLDGESEPIITEVRAALIAANDYDVTTNTEGMTFVDSTYTNGNPDHVTGSVDIATYTKVGPNNEVYLDKDQGIAFEISATGNIASIDIGAKAPTNGSAATLTANISSTTDTAGTGIEKTVQSGTPQYFNIMEGSTTDLQTIFANGKAYVLITNTGEGVLSITDIKVAYGENAGTVTYSVNADVVEFANTVVNTPTDVPSYDIISAEFETETCKLFETATMTVVTSPDVSVIKMTGLFGIDANPTVKNIEVNENGQLVWTIEIRMYILGDRTYRVTGFSSDGEIGESQTATIKVKVF